MKKVSLLFEKSLRFEWEKRGQKGVHGEVIFGLLCRFNDLLLYVFCNPTLPKEVAYENHFHGCLNRHELDREQMKKVAALSHRLAAHMRPVNAGLGALVELAVNFYEVEQRRPFANMTILMGGSRQVEEIRLQLMKE